MKAVMIVTAMIVLSVLLSAERADAQIDVAGIIAGGITKVIKAMDLKVQRLQNRIIWLQHAQKAVENAMTELRLGEIAGWVEKQSNLYSAYYSELVRVKNSVASYHRIRKVIDRQVELINAYKKGYALSRQDPHFTQKELDYIEKVYSGMLDQSRQHLERVLDISRPFLFQMSDAGRLKAIDAAFEAITRNYADLLRFNRQNVIVSLQRSKDQDEISQVKALYGLP